MGEAGQWYLAGHLVCIAQWAAFIMVHAACLGKGRIRHPLFWSVLLVAGVMYVSLVEELGFFTFASVLLSTVFLLLDSLLFGGGMGEKLTSCLINGIMCLLTENTVRYTASWFTGLTLSQVLQDNGCLMAMVLANLAVGVAVAYFADRWKRRRALAPLQALVMSFFPGVVVVLNIVLMVTGGEGHATPLMLLLTVGLTMAMLVHLAIVEMFNEEVVQRQASRFQAELEQQRAEALMDSYTAQRRLTHEFTNHMGALRTLLEQGDTAGAQEYIANVSKAVAAGTTIMDTHNPLLDSLLSKKYEDAGKKGVVVYFDLCDLKELPFASTDLVIVVSNLLDNAIRAAEKADPPEVYVRIKHAPEEYLISVRNRVVANIDLPDGQLPRTTKQEPGHGMGLANVCEVLNRYQAEYTFSCRDKWFRFTAAVPTGKL